MKKKLTILVFVDVYLPGFKSGGPVRTISNMVHTLGEEFDFKVFTTDRDKLDTQSYEGVQVDDWQKVGKAQVFYASEPMVSFRGVRNIISRTPFDVLYLNSFFNLRFSIVPLLLRRLGFLREVPVVLAPRGEFSEGALSLKSIKKTFFILLSRTFRLHKDIVWHASTEYERDDIIRTLGSELAREIHVAPNIPQSPEQTTLNRSSLLTKSYPLRVVFLSRISPKKNLHYALKVLQQVDRAVIFDIYGAVDDDAYWAGCKELIEKLPSNITAVYHGAVSHEKVANLVSTYDLFLLPTLGENYGHAIAESLSYGTPVLISDQTPWQSLEKQGAGWDLSLSKEANFVTVIESLADMNVDAYAKLRERAHKYAKNKLNDPLIIDSNRIVFMEAKRKTKLSWSEKKY